MPNTSLTIAHCANRYFHYPEKVTKFRGGWPEDPKSKIFRKLTIDWEFFFTVGNVSYFHSNFSVPFLFESCFWIFAQKF